MPVAVQAVPFLVVLALLAGVCGVLAGGWAAAPWLMAAGFVLSFFRDPERRPPQDDALIVAPADGRVMEVERRPEGARIAIFLSVFNCHVNRAPVSGTVLTARHTPGRFRPAWDRRGASENERNHLVIRAADGDYGVTQIAGVLARRIVCSRRPGDTLRRGDRLGLIQFGSRTDLHLPPGLEPLVQVGDRVRGALTVMARSGAAAEKRAAS